jgi:hypothetical protein
MTYRGCTLENLLNKVKDNPNKRVKEGLEK